MGFLPENVIVNLKKEIAEANGSSSYSDLTNKPKINNVELSGNKTTSDLGIPFVSFEVFDSTHLLGQEGITISKTKTLTADAWLIINVAGMAGNVSFTVNNTERLYIDGYNFYDHEIIPVYSGDVLALSVAADGSNDNLISSIILVTGIAVPPAPTNNNERSKRK